MVVAGMRGGGGTFGNLSFSQTPVLMSGVVIAITDSKQLFGLSEGPNVP